MERDYLNRINFGDFYRRLLPMPINPRELTEEEKKRLTEVATEIKTVCTGFLGDKSTDLRRGPLGEPYMIDSPEALKETRFKEAQLLVHWYEFRNYPSGMEDSTQRLFAFYPERVNKLIRHLSLDTK